MRRFADRADAGRLLARRLGRYRGRDDVVVLGLPRGGVPVAAPIAASLPALLDVFVVRKLGVPRQPELAAGAIAGGVIVTNDDVIAAAGMTRADLDAVIGRERRELARREIAYRQGCPPLPVAGRTVIVVDDGVATGATMRVALRALRSQGVARLVVAVPVGPVGVAEQLTPADEVICLATPRRFRGVGGAYHDFAQCTDDEVRAALGGRRGAGGY
ncbi:MAG: phosphoribosyltransferase family protein [Gordonia sp. (in: high G+C Gram-positive bacteria)]